MAADQTCAPGGVIIAVNECRDGHGAEGFYRSFQEAASPADLLRRIEARGRHGTEPDQWVSQLTAAILRRSRVILVSEAPPEVVRDLSMMPAAGLAEALALAEEMVGDAYAPLTVIPDAVSLVINEAEGNL